MGGIVTAHAEETLSVPAEEAGAGAVQMDGKDAQAAEDGSVAASEGLIAGSFKPSEIAQPAQDTYEYPFLGMKLGISKDLKEQMEKKNISMFTDERWNDNADAVTYATASWCTLTDEQKDAEVDKMGTGYDDWLKSISRNALDGIVCIYRCCFRVERFRGSGDLFHGDCCFCRVRGDHDYLVRV